MAPHTARGVAAVAVALVAVCSVSVCTAAAVQSDAEFQPFMDWFASIGGKANGVGLATFSGMGTGVLATEPITEGKVVISVPLEHVVCRQSLASSGDAVSQALTTIQSDEDMVSAWLMVQRFLGASSPYAPYIKALPRHVPLPGTFKKAELEMFEDRSLLRNGIKARQAMRGKLARITPVLRSAFPDLTEKQFKRLAHINRFVWAFNLVGSRALTIHGRKYLVPLADMFNYQPHGEERSADRGANFLKYHRLGDTTFDIVADRVAEPGAQLFEDYGDNDNRLYVNHHGFVAMDNPFDCVQLKLPKLPRDGKLGRQRVQLLKAMRVNPDRMDTCLRGDKKLPYAVHLYLATYLMDDATMQPCLPIIKGSRDRSLLQPCFGEAFTKQDALADPALATLLARVVESQLNSYSTTMRQDRALLSAPTGDDAALNEHEFIAVSFRLTRKQLLTNLLHAIRGESLEDFSQASAGAAAEEEEVATAGASTTDDQDGSATAVEAAVGVDGFVAPAEHVTDRVRTDAELQDIATSFNAWFAAANPPVMAIQAQWAGQGMRIGTMATRDIAAEEVYLSVPDSIIMSRQSARASPELKPLLARLDAKYPRGDAFHELLLHLMYEQFMLGPKSKFGPYLNIIPNKAEVGGPVFWSAKDLAELEGSHSLPAIQRYDRTLHQRYGAVQRAVFEPNRDLLPAHAFNFENYKWAYGILDSRSIWWNGERHLVPLLDLINCVEGPDPTRIHATVLDDTGKNAITKAGWTFAKGEQLFENYGQPNHIYFEYHGFSLAENTHDCAQVDGFELPAGSDVQKLGEQLRPAGVNAANPVFCLEPHGFMPRQMTTYFRVAHGVTKSSAQREMAKVAVAAHLEGYPTSIAEDEALLANDGAAVGGIGSHQWNAVQFRLTEKRVLQAWMDAQAKYDK